jgi:hypothetical protein
LEATYGYYWAADLLKGQWGQRPPGAPAGAALGLEKSENDIKDATELAKRLWRDDLPEAWVAPPEVRELREIVRYRAKLVALRTRPKPRRIGSRGAM